VIGQHLQPQRPEVIDVAIAAGRNLEAHSWSLRCREHVITEHEFHDGGVLTAPSTVTDRSPRQNFPSIYG
jgi:hypothetical protein